MTSKLTITDERLAELVAFKPLPGTDINSATRDEWMAMAAELQERRNAERDSNPVGWTDEAELRDVEKDGCGYLFKANPITPHADPRRVIPLYRHAQQPVVPRVTCWSCRNQVEISAIGGCDGYCPECDAPIDLGEEPYTSEQPVPVVPDIDELRLAFEAAERESGDGFNLHKYGIGYADDKTQGRWDTWLACRAAMLQAGNYPVIPDGYVMVPKEPTPEILAVISEAIKSMRGSAATYARVLAAAPQEVSHG